MRTAGVTYFVEHLDEMLSMVEQGETIELLDEGNVVARVVPPVEDEQRDKEEVEIFLAIMDEIEKEVSSHITGPVDAVEMIRDIRRDL